MAGGYCLADKNGKIIIGDYSGKNTYPLNSSKYKKYEANYLKSFHYLIDLAYSLLPKVDSVEENEKKNKEDIEGGFNSEKDDSDIEEDRKEEISLLEKEIKPYVYNEDYDDVHTITIK